MVIAAVFRRMPHKCFKSFKEFWEDCIFWSEVAEKMQLWSLPHWHCHVQGSFWKPNPPLISLYKDKILVNASGNWVGIPCMKLLWVLKFISRWWITSLPNCDLMLFIATLPRRLMKLSPWSKNNKTKKQELPSCVVPTQVGLLIWIGSPVFWKSMVWS